MKITILTVGKLSRTPEGQLAADYIARAQAGGRALGFPAIDLVEVESRKPGKEAEGEAILAAVPEGAYLVCCDEHGDQPTSRKFSERIAALRDADVVMALRIQKERMASGLLPSLREYAARYGLTQARLRAARPEVIVMHPGPMNEGVEIAPDVAAGPRSLVTEQVANGVAIRMAVLALCAGPAA